MHARKSARDAWFPTSEDHSFFATRGDVVFADSGAARRFAGIGCEERYRHATGKAEVCIVARDQVTARSGGDTGTIPESPSLPA